MTYNAVISLFVFCHSSHVFQKLVGQLLCSGTFYSNFLNHVDFLCTTRKEHCLLYGLTNSQLAKIQRVPHASARLVCNAPRFCHITPIMRDLYWLPIRARINSKVLLLTFKALHGLAPQYLRSLISIKTSCCNLRGSNTLLLAMPSVKSEATLDDREFAVAAPSSWNSLPCELRSITCVTSFKTQLKTYLFSLAYT